MYLNLFWNFFQIGLFSFGGGYAAIPLIQSKVVTAYGWMSMAEFTDLVTISQMMPGAIALNSATFVGTQLAGFLGAVVSTAGCVLPSCIIVSFLSYLYRKYNDLPAIKGTLAALRPAVVALIFSAGLSILLSAVYGRGGFILQTVDLAAAGLFLAGLFVLRKFKLSPMLIMLGSGVVGGLIYYFA